ncbi:MAG TPA: aldo/keto reductase, partial [Streptosporangiaceae bacterium]|nr:aldo/keto reductase [Streptosporangiaceae bacterium]
RTWQAARHLTEETFAALDLLRQISDQLGASMAAVALAWVRQQPEVTSTIIGARTVEQLEVNLASLQITIPDPQLAELDEVTRPQLEFPAELLKTIAPSYQQAGATINGVESSQFHR